jgi:hypothetical protein
MMTSVILLFSLLNPTLDEYASELLVPERTEPRCDALERMLAKFDAEYTVELVDETVDSIFHG